MSATNEGLNEMSLHLARAGTLGKPVSESKEAKGTTQNHAWGRDNQTSFDLPW